MSQSSPTKTILVIDDSESLRAAVSEVLTTAGCEVLEAEDGAAALQQLDGRRIHLIFCDVYMPNMDGITFVSLARQQNTYRYTPIIMLTTEHSEEMKLQGQIAGAHAWMVKPFNAEQLIKAVSKLAK